MANKYKDQVQAFLLSADIHIDGDRPWDMHVHNDLLYERILKGESIALGESYMEEWWDCDQIDEFIARILRSKKISPQFHLHLRLILSLVLHHISSKIFPANPFEIGKVHYDIGNDLFSAMLGKTMLYTCAYWKNATTLDEAQEAKIDLICRKIGLKAGQKILDIGCGWGSFAYYAAKKYGAIVTGITVSQEQVEYARDLNKNLPVKIRYQDYHDLHETFDHIVSIGMFEHVGDKNYADFMKIIRRCLSDNGIFLLHTIGGNHSVHHNDAWIEKYIFPHSTIPSIRQIATAIEGVLVMEDWHNFGLYYDKTLRAWFVNFEQAWPILKNHYDQKFYRMWKFYLLACAGSFRSRDNHLWQIVLSKNGLTSPYHSVR